MWGPYIDGQTIQGLPSLKNSCSCTHHQRERCKNQLEINSWFLQSQHIIAEEFDDIIDDIKDMAQHYGEVISIHVPTIPKSKEEKMDEKQEEKNTKTKSRSKSRSRSRSRDKKNRRTEKQSKKERSFRDKNKHKKRSSSRNNSPNRHQSNSSESRNRKTEKRKPKRPNVPGLGHVFIEYLTVDAAKNSRTQITKKLFRGRAVEGRYFEEHRYLMGDFSLNLGYLNNSQN